MKTLLHLMVVTCLWSLFNDSAIAQHEFITTWKTDNTGSSGATEMYITTNSDYNYNYDVDWNNDGIFEQTGITGDVTHDFGTAGTYTIRIQGTFPTITFFEENDAAKLVSIDQWGAIAWEDMTGAFAECVNMQYNAVDAPDLSNVTSLKYMFSGCTLFNGNLSNWKVSTIEDMSFMFSGSAFNQDISQWDVSAVTNMSGMFSFTPFNKNIGNWNTSSVTKTTTMFKSSEFNQDISGWDMSQVTSISTMFSNNTVFNQDISNWNVSKVMHMSKLFWGATAFNQDLSAWNVGMVTDMERMFCEATSFDQNLGGWDISNVTTMAYMFEGVTLSTDNYDALLTGWLGTTPKFDVQFHGGNSTYCAAEMDRAALDGPYRWTITDGGKDCSVQ